MLSRESQLAALARPLDVLVIGGGITGAGVALDAASRGYRVGLVEQADFAGGTSSRSTKLIHGGIRYLAKGQLKLVGEALRERARLMRLAPHLVTPQPFLIPLYEGLTRPLGVGVPALLRPAVPLGVRAALATYDWLARVPALRHRRVSTPEALALVPLLRTEGLRAAFLFYDARTDDVRLTLTVLATARRFGAATVNYVKAQMLRVDGGRVAGALVQDLLTGRAVEVRARHVVNAAGAWADQVAAMNGASPFRIRSSRGVHLVLRPRVLPTATALVIPETEDGRLAFLVPWSGRVLLGTTDDAYDGPIEAAHATPEDVAFLLRQADRYLKQRVERSDIVGLYAGVRPLIEGGNQSADLPREHQVVESSGGVVSIIGGKLTSYRMMAEDTVDVLVRRDGGDRPCQTATLSLAGAENLDIARQQLMSAGVPGATRERLLATYGSAASEILTMGAENSAWLQPLVEDLPVLSAEVVHACRHELAVSLADVMFLRTRLSVLCEDAGAAAVARVAELMAGELRWDGAETSYQRTAWEERVARERAALRSM